MTSALPHWEPTFGPPRPATTLVAPALGPLAPRRQRGISRPAAVSALLHALILVLILVELDLPDWLRRTPPEQPPAIEVALVVEPPPPPPPPAPQAKPVPPPPPLPRAPLSSDAQSEGPGKPKPAKQEDEPAPAVAKPEPGPQAAPPEPRKAEAPTPQPAPKPQAAEPRPHTPVPPPPRSTLHATPQPAPAPAAPVKPNEPETQTAAAAPPKEIAPTPRGEQPPAPAFGKAVYRGFAMAALDVPAGVSPALYNAYLAAIRDKLALERGRLRTFRFSGGGVRVHFVLDRQGRLQQNQVVASSGSRALENTVLNMLSYAAPFPPPPAEFGGAEIFLRFDMILPTSAADWEEFLAGAKG